MTEYKGHHHGEYDDECPLCYLDRIIEEKDAQLKLFRKEIKSLKVKMWKTRLTIMGYLND